jgi:hypothetical protein
MMFKGGLGCIYIESKLKGMNDDYMSGRMNRFIVEGGNRKAKIVDKTW